MLARTTYADSAPEPALEALRRAESCSAPHPEATLFRLLLTPFDLANLKQSQNEREQELLLLGRAHPRLAALADAAQHLHTELGAARRMASTRTLLELAATHAPEVGSFVELGVFHGTSLRWLAPFRTGNLHGFDSFQGLPAGWDSVPEGRFTTRGRVPEDVPARFWVGSFEEQLPRFVASSPDPIALLHVDSDLYESARSGLQHLGPLLRPGSILVFDQYFGHHGWRQDEHRAFNEATRAHGWSVEPLAVNPFTGQAAFRLLQQRLTRRKEISRGLQKRRPLARHQHNGT